MPCGTSCLHTNPGNQARRLKNDGLLKTVGIPDAMAHPEIERGRLISCPRLLDEMRAVHEYEIECGRASVSTKEICAHF